SAGTKRGSGWQGCSGFRRAVVPTRLLEVVCIDRMVEVGTGEGRDVELGRQSVVVGELDRVGTGGRRRCGHRSLIISQRGGGPRWGVDQQPDPTLLDRNVELVLWSSALRRIVTGGRKLPVTGPRQRV